MTCFQGARDAKRRAARLVEDLIALHAALDTADLQLALEGATRRWSECATTSWAEIAPRTTVALSGIF